MSRLIAKPFQKTSLQASFVPQSYLNVVEELPAIQNYKKKLLEKVVGLQPSSCLDLGCGTGAFCFKLAQKLPSCRILGIDHHASSIDIAKNRLYSMNAQVICSDLFDVHQILPSVRYDVIILDRVLQHIRKSKLQNLIHLLKLIGRNIFLVDVDYNQISLFPKNKLSHLIEKNIARSISYYPQAIYDLISYFHDEKALMIWNETLLMSFVSFDSLDAFAQIQSLVLPSMIKRNIISLEEAMMWVHEAKQSQPNGHIQLDLGVRLIQIQLD